jgi:CubicO group peptidase (beta-lactamase class C family)
MFSTTKALSALSVAMLVQQGHLKWDDKISKFWPEYAQNGKQETTVQHVLSHQAGIPYIKESIYYDDALNITKALDKIARSTPIWKP